MTDWERDDSIKSWQWAVAQLREALLESRRREAVMPEELEDCPGGPVLAARGRAVRDD